MKYLKKFSTEDSKTIWMSSGSNSKINPITYFVEENGTVYYREYVNMNPNGHEYVDLGLPSGTFWATCNFGAAASTAYGDHYSWGELSPINNDNDYSYYVYEEPWYSKYNSVDKKYRLEPADDVVSITWGGGWHIPTSDQLEELVDGNYTTLSVETIDNASVVRVTSNTNGNSIILPLPGFKYRDEGDLYTSDEGTGAGYMGMDLTKYLSNFYGSDSGGYDSFLGLSLYIGDSNAYPYPDEWFSRSYGYSIRPVLGDKKFQRLHTVD